MHHVNKLNVLSQFYADWKYLGLPENGGNNDYFKT